MWSGSLSYVGSRVYKSWLFSFTSPGLSISLVVVSSTDKSGCGKLERSRACPSLYQYAVMWSGTLSYIGSRVNKSWLLCSQVLGCLLVL